MLITVSSHQSNLLFIFPFNAFQLRMANNRLKLCWRILMQCLGLAFGGFGLIGGIFYQRIQEP